MSDKLITWFNFSSCSSFLFIMAVKRNRNPSVLYIYNSLLLLSTLAYLLLILEYPVNFGVHLTDVSPHLVFKNGMTPTLWPQDMPFPADEGKEEVASTFGDDTNTQQPGDRSCFSPSSMQYPAYFKDSKGMNLGEYTFPLHQQFYCRYLSIPL